MPNYSLISLFLVAQVLDVSTTFIGIHHFNLVEFNPIAQYSFEQVGMPGFMIVKLLIAFMVVIIYLRQPRLKIVMETSLSISSLIIWNIVFSNFALILTESKLL